MHDATLRKALLNACQEEAAVAAEVVALEKRGHYAQASDAQLEINAFAKRHGSPYLNLNGQCKLVVQTTLTSDSHIPNQRKETIMEICSLCQEQTKKTHRGKPHEILIKIDAPRVFSGLRPRGYEEQDYKCLVCDSRFTQSTSKNDLAWTLWQG